MPVYIVRVKDKKKTSLFLKLMKELSFIEVTPSSSVHERNIVKVAVMRGMDEIEAHERGEVEFRSAHEMLKELDAAPRTERANRPKRKARSAKTGK